MHGSSAHLCRPTLPGEGSSKLLRANLRSWHIVHSWQGEEGERGAGGEGEREAGSVGGREGGREGGGGAVLERDSWETNHEHSMYSQLL